jgi:hypothetical protein
VLKNSLFANSTSWFIYGIWQEVMRRRSKRTSAILKDGIRRSRRNVAAKESDDKIYGEDYGILPSD